MKSLKKCCIGLLIATVIALTLRGHGLGQRPMHTDEAVHGIKFISLLENGEYVYNPVEYHGPTLNYFTLVSAWLSGAKGGMDIDEVTVRAVAAFFGVLLVVLFLLFYDGLGSRVLVFGAVLTAVSPAFVFYSRYYIQEMLLVCFTFGFIGGLWRYLQGGKVRWLIFAGGFAGFMHATKETCIIAFGAMFVSGVVVYFMSRGKGEESIGRKITAWHVGVGVLSGFFVSALFYSSFFSNFGGVVDSFLTYKNYFGKAGEAGGHVHSWYYYLERLMYFKLGDGPIWSEGFILVLSVVGFVLVMKGKVGRGVDVWVGRFFGFYTLIMVVVYSAIGYKTPWCCLGFLHGMIILCAIAVSVAADKFAGRQGGKVVWLVVLVGVLHLGYQSCLGCFKYDSSSENPYVYGHTGDDIFAMVDSVERAAELSGKGRELGIEVACSGHDYWPLPWYLRGFDNILWGSEIDLERKAEDVIIISPDLQGQLLKKLYDVPGPGEKQMYVYLFDHDLYLRPGIELLGFISKDLSDVISSNESDGPE